MENHGKLEGSNLVPCLILIGALESDLDWLLYRYF